MERENELIKRFNQGFWLFLAAIIVCILSAILLFALKNKLFKNYNNNRISEIVLYGFIAIFMVVSVVSSIKFVSYSKDFKNVNERKFEKIIGTVIKYDYVREGNSPKNPIELKPFVKDIVTGIVIKLDVIGTELNQTYEFMYLPNSKLAVIINYF